MPKYRVTLSNGKSYIVNASAPPTEADLSDFLSKQSAGPTSEPTEQSFNQPTNDAPSAEGFLSNAAGDAMDVASSLPGALSHAIHHPIDTATAVPVGILNRIKTIASDMHPIDAAKSAMQGEYTQAAGQLLPVGELYHKPVTAAADLMGGMSLVKGIKSLAEAPGVMRAADDAARVGQYVPNKSAYTNHISGKPIPEAPGQFTGPSEAIVDRYAPNKSGYERDIHSSVEQPPDVPGGGVAGPVRTGSPVKSTDDMIYDTMIERLGGNKGYTGPERRGPQPNGPGGQRRVGDLAKADNTVATTAEVTPKSMSADVAKHQTTDDLAQPEREITPYESSRESTQTGDVADVTGGIGIERRASARNSLDKVTARTDRLMQSKRNVGYQGPERRNPAPGTERTNDPNDHENGLWSSEDREALRGPDGKIPPVPDPHDPVKDMQIRALEDAADQWDPPKVPIDDRYSTRLSRSDEPSGPNWHSESEDPLEKSQASALHREDRALNDRFNFLRDDESGSVMAGVPITLARMLMRHLVNEATKSALPTIGGPLKRGIVGGIDLGKRTTNIANVSRFGEPDDPDRR